MPSADASFIYLPNRSQLNGPLVDPLLLLLLLLVLTCCSWHGKRVTCGRHMPLKAAAARGTARVCGHLTYGQPVRQPEWQPPCTLPQFHSHLHWQLRMGNCVVSSCSTDCCSCNIRTWCAHANSVVLPILIRTYVQVLLILQISHDSLSLLPPFACSSSNSFACVSHDDLSSLWLIARETTVTIAPTFIITMYWCGLTIPDGLLQLVCTCWTLLQVARV